jgi:GT2 family glycosyltransferase
MQPRTLSDTSNLPTLSVVTIVRNGKREIAKTMDSVLEQDYPNIEYVVIDGASTDGTLDIIQEYTDKLEVFVSERDEGIYDAMNKGIGLSSGEFVLLMNCGDVFASANAVSSAMRFVHPSGDQILFGHWLRLAPDNSLTPRYPVIKKGLFNHQAVIYSRSIHAWHGGYVNVKGLTAADYLFFATLFNSPSVTCRVIETTIAIIDISGQSAGLQTVSQKFAIDYFCGRISKFRLLIVLIVHPLYWRIKSLLGWVR